MIEIKIVRGYVSAAVAAEILGVSRQRIHQLLQAQRFPGAILVDHGDKPPMWAIPRKSIANLTDLRKQKTFKWPQTKPKSTCTAQPQTEHHT